MFYVPCFIRLNLVSSLQKSVLGRPINFPEIKDYQFTKRQKLESFAFTTQFDAGSWINSGRSFGIGVCGTPYCTDLPSTDCNSIMPVYTMKIDYSVKHDTVGDRILTDTLRVRYCVGWGASVQPQSDTEFLHDISVVKTVGECSYYASGQEVIINMNGQLVSSP